MGERMKRMLDLCSGFGGASEAFAKHPQWEVTRIEKLPAFTDVPHTTLADILTWEPPGFYDLVWASPPCREFSNSYEAPRARAERRNEEYVPSMELVDRCLALISEIQPKNWVLENVFGAIPFFKDEPMLGEPRQCVSSFAFWGNFPLLHLPPYWSHSKATGDTWSNDPLRAQRRAMIPPEISQALLQAVNVKRLDDYPLL